jgi:hypothetical protein
MRAELGSNDGESAIALDLQRRYTYATEPGFEGSVQICGGVIGSTTTLMTATSLSRVCGYARH